jgi:hypothetical protein
MVKGSVTVGLIVENNIRMYLYGERISERIVLFGLIVENSMKLVISHGCICMVKGLVKE